jgi:hypothetical protein
VGQGEGFCQLEPLALAAAGVQIVDVPGRLLAGHQVPQEAPEAVVQDFSRPGWAPEVVGPVDAAVHAAEEGVEAGDMVHVQVGEEQVIEALDHAERQLRQTALAAVEQQAADSLACVDGHQHGVVPAGFAQHLEGEGHEKVSSTWRSRNRAVPVRPAWKTDGDLFGAVHVIVAETAGRAWSGNIRRCGWVGPPAPDAPLAPASRPGPRPAPGSTLGARCYG